MGNPADRTGQRKDRREQTDWNADGALHDARIEVHIGIELALHEVVVFKGNFFEGHRQLEQWVIFETQRCQHFLASLLHQLGARVVVLVDPMAKTHQFDARALVLDLFHELANFGHSTHSLDVFEHVQTGLVGATMCRAPQASDTRSNSSKGVGARAAAQAYGGGRGVLLVVSVEHENAVKRSLDDWVDVVILAGCGKHHVQEVAGIAQLVLRVHVRLTGAVLVGHGHQRRHFCNQSDRRYFPMLWVVDVGAVVVEGREGADQPGHDGHRVRVAAETAQEELHLLIDHGVVGHTLGEVGLSCDVGQVAIQQQMTGFHEVTAGGQLFDRVATVEQFTFVAIDVGDGRLTRRR